jgi:prepilin-type processing-associated H-X9-DG protein
LGRFDRREGENWAPEWAGTDNGIIEGCEITSSPYQYAGWTFTQEMKLRATMPNMQLMTLRTRMEEGPHRKTEDLTLPMPPEYTGPDNIYRLREGIERFFITDINNPGASAQGQSSLAVMWDGLCARNVNHFSHWPSGGNVLYLDGHVAWQTLGYITRTINGTEQHNDTQFPFGATGYALHMVEMMVGHAMSQAM